MIVIIRSMFCALCATEDPIPSPPCTADVAYRQRMMTCVVRIPTQVRHSCQPHGVCEDVTDTTDWARHADADETFASRVLPRKGLRADLYPLLAAEFSKLLPDLVSNLERDPDVQAQLPPVLSDVEVAEAMQRIRERVRLSLDADRGAE